MKVGTDGVLIGAWANHDGAKQILDIGTGTGLIAIMAAQKNTIAQIDAIDIDESASRQAEKNSSLCPWSTRIEVFHTGLQDFSTSKKYQSIVCNPPFFNAGTASHKNKRQIARHTSTLSYSDLLQGIQRLLDTNGKFSLILPYLEGLGFIKLAKDSQLLLTKLTEVHSKKEKPIERLLMEFQRKEQTLQKNQLIIQFEQRNDWTPEYIELTKAFYLKM